MRSLYDKYGSHTAEILSKSACIFADKMPNTGFSTGRLRIIENIGEESIIFLQSVGCMVKWKCRLVKGVPKETDILLLQHELLEAQMEKEYNISMAEVHKIAKEKYP